MNQAEVARTRQDMRTAREHTQRALRRAKLMMDDDYRIGPIWHELSQLRADLSEAMRAGASADHRLALHAGVDVPNASGFRIETDERVPPGVVVAYDRATFTSEDRQRMIDQIREKYRNLTPGDICLYTEHAVTEAGTIRETYTIYPGTSAAARAAYDRMVERGSFQCLVIDLWQWLRGRAPR